MKWFVGLGNPGKEYESTRHNIGWMALDEAARRWGMAFGPNARLKGAVAEGRVEGEKVYLIKPMTYMNLSGECVRAFLDFYKADPADLVVVYDDMDTEIGSLRLRMKGSPGGHNGIKSIIAHLGSDQFHRIRMGISRPAAGSDIVSYVLAPFRKEEQAALQTTVEKAADAMQFCITNHFEKTMAKFNG